RLPVQRPGPADRHGAARHKARRGHHRARPSAAGRRAARDLVGAGAGGRRGRSPPLRVLAAPRLPRPDRARVPEDEARRARVEHLAHRRGARHRAHEPPQAAPRARPLARGERVIAALVMLAVLDASGEFYRGTDLERDGRDAEAAEVMRRIVAEAPTDPFADDALFELARLEEEKLGDPAGAARDYRRLAHDYPDSRLAVRAQRRAEALGRELGPEGAAAEAAAECGK